MTFPKHWVAFYFRTLNRQVGHPQLVTDTSTKTGPCGDMGVLTLSSQLHFPSCVAMVAPNSQGKGLHVPPVPHLKSLCRASRCCHEAQSLELNPQEHERGGAASPCPLCHPWLRTLPSPQPEPFWVGTFVGNCPQCGLAIICHHGCKFRVALLCSMTSWCRWACDL